MNKQQEALKLALEALEKMGRVMKQSPDTEKAIIAIREALAEQPAHQPYCNDCGGFDPECPLAQSAQQQEPGNWSVYNSGAEVASGLTFAEALDYMTPERLARQWCAVCVVDQSNLPTSPPASKPLTDEEIKRMAAKWFLSMYWPICNTFAREIEAKLREKNA